MAKKADRSGQLITDIKEPLTLDQEHELLTHRIIERKNQKPEWTSSPYGHAAFSLAVLHAVSANEVSPAEERAALIKKRDQLIAKFGPEIINFLKEELRIDLSKL
jgi:hypothetical protein